MKRSSSLYHYTPKKEKKKKRYDSKKTHPSSSHNTNLLLDPGAKRHIITQNWERFFFPPLCWVPNRERDPPVVMLMTTALTPTPQNLLLLTRQSVIPSSIHSASDKKKSLSCHTRLLFRTYGSALTQSAYLYCITCKNT